MKVKILNRTYDIKKVSDKLTIPNEGNWGVISHIDLTISIANNLKPEIQFETFLHECVHAIEGQLGLEFDEAMIDKLACGIYSLIVDNDIYKIRGYIHGAK